MEARSHCVRLTRIHVRDQSRSDRKKATRCSGRDPTRPSPHRNAAEAHEEPARSGGASAGTQAQLGRFPRRVLAAGLRGAAKLA